MSVEGVYCGYEDPSRENGTGEGNSVLIARVYGGVGREKHCGCTRRGDFSWPGAPSSGLGRRAVDPRGGGIAAGFHGG